MFRRSALAVLLASACLPAFLQAAPHTFRIDRNRIDGSLTRAWVVGSFNEWQPNATPLTAEKDAFTATVDLADGLHQYKFRFGTDTEEEELWRTDPANAVFAPDGLGGMNSVLIIEGGKSAKPGAGFEHFRWADLDAQEIFVSGDFIKWEPRAVPLRKDAEGNWNAWVKVDRPLSYKFVVDGEWTTEGEYKGVVVATDPSGSQNNHRPKGEVTDYSQPPAPPKKKPAKKPALDPAAPGTTLQPMMPEDAPAGPPADVTFTVGARFIIPAPLTVFLVGSFNDWEKNPGFRLDKTDSGFSGTFKIRPGEHAYRFLVVDENGDTRLVVDPANSDYLLDGRGGINNVVAVKDGKRVPPPSTEVFEWSAPEAMNVSVAGSFNNWDPNQIMLRKTEKGSWRASVKIPRPFTYKYVVDGEWLTEVEAPGIALEADPIGATNNVRK